MTLNVTISDKHYNQSFQLTHHNTWLLWCCQLINIGCLASEISRWMLAILALCLAWQALLNIKKINNSYANALNSQTKISPPLLTLFALSGCIAIGATANNLGVLISMVHLLTFAYVLKTFEIKQRKDFYQVCLLGLFLLASALIFKQDLLFSVLIVFALILNLMVLLQVSTPTQKLLASAKTVTLLLAQSSLLAIVLFIVFPRLSPFWQVPNSQSAKTGLSDEVSPGDIANLALSSDLAFRVDFNGGKIPQYDKLYWRAMTLENYDGRKWSRRQLENENENQNKLFLSPKLFTPVTLGEGLNYNVIVEPSHQVWLFGLSVVTTDDPNLRLMDDYTVQSKTVLSQISHYELTSYLESPLDLSINATQKQRNLAIVKGSNPKLEKLAVELQQKYANPVDRSNAILAWFREHQYFYTLKPPLLINNSLDQFFFETKAGFCVYYASAYTYLMRAAGIPARVVTGYLGGEYNNTGGLDNNVPNAIQGGHLSIYQYDAHAWSEIWLDGIGWQRVDPTAAVDPQRVESGWSNDLLSQQLSLNNDFFGLSQYRKMAWLNAIRLQFDALDYQWTRWVLGYSNAQQYDLLKRWFGGNIQWKAAAIVVATLIIMMTLFIVLYRVNTKLFKRQKVEPWLKLYQQALKKLAKKGMVKPDNMSPTDFAIQVNKQHPKIGKPFTELTTTFELLMFKKLSDKQQVRYLSKLKFQYSQFKKV